MRGKDESPKGRPRVTIKDLAEDLGMSVSTISRAFQKGSPISDRAREIVLNRAEEMGYKANPFARSLVGKKSRIVGVLVSRISSTFYYEILNRIAEYLREDNLTLMLVAGEHVHEVQEGLNMLMAYDPLAVLVFSSFSDADSIALSPTARNKLLYFNRVPADSFSVGVAYDNHLAGARMADYLAGLGHRRGWIPRPIMNGIRDSARVASKRDWTSPCCSEPRVSPMRGEWQRRRMSWRGWTTLMPCSARRIFWRWG